MPTFPRKVRQQLDEAGYPDAKIYASNDLDENTILNLKMQHAKIDVWGVGTKLITAYDQPALGAVYKIVAIEDETGRCAIPSSFLNNAEKVSTPGRSRLAHYQSGKGKSEGTTLPMMEWMSGHDRNQDVPSDLYLHQKTSSEF